jgi:hypothetical protein
MRQDKLKKTESTFSTNKQVRAAAGHSDFKRDGTVKNISTSLYDIDYAIKWHLETIVQPTILEENSIITVPIIFANGEKWASVQKHGCLRDSQGKNLTPLIMIRRNSVSKREDIQDLKVLESAEARITVERKYTKNNRYSRFAITGVPIEKEYYSVDVPKFVQVEYELICWTNNTVQLNEIVENLLWHDGKAFGDTYKFITNIDPPSFENMNNVGEDRVVKATLPMRVKAHILNASGPNAPIMYKLNPINRFVMGLEVVGGTEIFSSTSARPASTISSTLPSNTGGTSNSSNLTAVTTYININRQLTGTVINNNTIEFPSNWEVAPLGMAATSIDNFVFFHKKLNWEMGSTLIPRTAIISFTESAGISTLVLNTTNLDYDLVAGDEVVGIGKFINQDALA